MHGPAFQASGRALSSGRAAAPLRVLTFLHSFAPGGVERTALQLVRRWRALGVDAPLFMGRTDGAMAGDVGSGLSPLRPDRPGIGIAHYETLWMILTLPKVVRACRPDILFCAGNTYAIVSVVMKLLLGRQCPPIVAKISNDLERRDMPWWSRLPYHLWLRVQGRAIDHVVSMDRSMEQEIGRHLAVPPHRITTIPDPALSAALIAKLRAMPAPAIDRSCGRRFVAVGRLVPQKNFALLLRAFQRGAETGDRLTLIGDGPERGRLEALAHRLGIADRVLFRGYVADPASMLPDFHILLLSSDYEGVPAVILEALAARLKIIATDCSRSMPALLQHGRLGALVPVGDEARLADAIARAEAGGQDERLSLAQAESFTVERGAELYLATMARVARPVPRRSPFFHRRLREQPADAS